MAIFKSFSTFLIVIFFIANANGKSRIYDPSEDDPSRRKSFLWEDANGKMHHETLVPDIGMRASSSIPEIRFCLYTKDNPEYPEDFKPDENVGDLIFFENYRQTMFLIHGWNNDYSSSVNKVLTKALLARYDMNVIVVDWRKEANKNYFSSKAAVPKVGVLLGDFIKKSTEQNQMSPQTVMMIGHSLGAHVAGHAGATLNGTVSYIIGLDPASPLFSVSDTDSRLDQSDAAFVQVIHTNGGYLGFKSSLGDADYFPNGGSKQPGCGWDVLGKCAHGRSYHYLAESILWSGFSAHLCDNFNEFEAGDCDTNDVSYLGEYRVDKSADGDYFLITNSEPPYACTQSHPNQN